MFSFFSVDSFFLSHKFINLSFRALKSITGREVSCYSISAKNQVNIDVTLDWLIHHSKSAN